MSKLILPNHMGINQNGGFYLKGRSYSLVKKYEVLQEYRRMVVSTQSVPKPTILALARRAKVSWRFARDVISEFQITGKLSDPKKCSNKTMAKEGGSCPIRNACSFFHFTLKIHPVSVRRTVENFTNIMAKLFRCQQFPIFSWNGGHMLAHFGSLAKLHLTSGKWKTSFVSQL